MLLCISFQLTYYHPFDSARNAQVQQCQLQKQHMKHAGGLELYLMNDVTSKRQLADAGQEVTIIAVTGLPANARYPQGLTLL